MGLRHAIRRHERLLWSLHSLYALAAGVVVMWIGAHHFAVLRYVFAQIAFIWATSLILPWIDRRPSLGPRTRWWLRAIATYLNKDFYQQLLFFVLPMYFASATLTSWNVVFLALVAISAVMASIDVVYDHHVAARPTIAAAFFAFNLFACFNVALPVLWQIGNELAIWTSAALAITGFLTLRFPPADWRRPHVRRVAIAGCALVFVLVIWGRPLVPPAPLRVASVGFGTALSEHPLAMTQPVALLDPTWSGELYAMTSIVAPLGLHERVRHRWYQDGRMIYASPYYKVSGGRTEGYRLWTRDHVSVTAGSRIRVDVETEGGQLIGRAKIETGE
ncbi:MAG TPA: DUF5924 family protein [Vicinamibacterales bacterium]|jgi:hypothetical protein